MRHLLPRRLLGAATAVATAVGLAVVGAAPAWAAAPANDDFANAQAQTGSFTDSLNNADATTEASEPAPNCIVGVEVHTVWYGLTVSAGTQVTADTIGSNFDTALAVYTGPSLGSLTQIACNDDGGGNFTSLVQFTASSSTTYWIQASGCDCDPLGGLANSGTLDLNVVATPPAGADVSVSVTDSPDPVSLGGGNVTYTLSVANAGPSGATGVTTATLLSGASAGIVSATPSQGSCSISAPQVDCSLGSIAASGSATVTITVTPAATGTITATSVVDATETDPVDGNNTAAESTTVNNALGCTITGTNGNDTLNGTNGADVICGLGGDDTIHGGNGNDTIYGGPGNDTIYGGNGNDTINGGPGNDIIDGGNGDDVLTDTSGTDTLSGGNGDDTINVQDGTGGDTANGGNGNDTCTVDTGDTTNSC
jgi:Ca2+-binding RTX toxin-like protein